MNVKIVNKSKHPNPSYATVNSAGMDLRADIDEDIVLKPLERKLIPTNLYIQLPTGYEAQIRPRSGLALKHGITVLNTPGTIDCFSENSNIATLDGEINIKDLKINDIILSMNDNLEIQKDVITAIIDKDIQDILIIETEDGVLEITPNTLVYTDRGLLYANELTENDSIIHI